jgi:hypothetical protein
MTSVRLLAAALLAPMAFLAGCSRPSDVSLIGHWQAERISVYSAKLPIGPDIVVKEDRISNPATGMDLPIKGIERKGNEATVDFDYGLGVTFYFDSVDRVHIDVPLIGKIYYRRVNDNAPASAALASSIPGATSEAEVVQAAPPASDPAHQVASAPEKTNVPPAALRASQIPVAQVDVTSQSGADGAVTAHDSDYQKALAAAMAGQQDRALDYLNAAFRDGFRDFARLDAAPELADLRSDVRYQALVGRYR